MNIHKKLQKIGRELAEMASTKPEIDFMKGDTIYVYDSDDVKYAAEIRTNPVWNKDYMQWTVKVLLQKRLEGTRKWTAMWEEDSKAWYFEGL